MKSKLQRLYTVFVIIALIISNMCTVSLAEGAIEISLKPVVMEVTNIKIEGTLSGDVDKKVTIFVVPETIGDYTINSVENFLDAIREDIVADGFVYASEKLSTDGNFVFAFTVPTTGRYVALVNSEDAGDLVLASFQTAGYEEYLNSLGGDYDAFKMALTDDRFKIIECGLYDKYILLDTSYKDDVIESLYTMLNFADMNDLRIKADSAIQNVFDGILADIISNSTDAQYAIGIMRKMPALFNVNKLSVYDNNLVDNRKVAVDAELCAKLSDCDTLEEVGALFDTAVDNQLMQVETDIVNSFNSVSLSVDFATLLKNSMELLGLTDAECKLMDRLSSSMHSKLSSFMMASSDNNNDGNSNFESIAQITAAFRTAVANEGDSTLALDMINNRNNASEIIDILNEYIHLIDGLDIAGFEALGDSNDALYRKYVIDEFLKGGPDVSLSAIKQRFNNIVADANVLRSLLEKINSGKYSDMTEVLSDSNMVLLNLSNDTKSNYAYVRNNSTSEYTNLINDLIKYIPYNTLEDFGAKVTQVVKSARDNINSNGNNNVYTGSNGAGGRDYTVHGGSFADIGSSSNENIFTDIDSIPWAKTQILDLAERGILSGTGNGLFAPNQYVTREQFVKMLVEAYGLYNANAACDFADVAKDSWYYGYVASGYEAGIVQGDGNGNFGAGQPITREDMAVLAYRAYTMINGNLDYAGQETGFGDSASISAYAVDAVSALRHAGYISGTGNGLFSPKNTCTRAEAAVIIFNMIG